jgi:hypothetical protein
MPHRNRSECQYYSSWGYDASCGASEAGCSHPKGSVYCIHEGYNHKCPARFDRTNQYSCTK